MNLPPFPTDDVTLALPDHACRGAISDEGDVVGADMTMPQLLDFLSGPSEVDVIRTEDCYDMPPTIEVRREPAYSETDVIRALIAHIRTLQKEHP